MRPVSERSRKEGEPRRLSGIDSILRRRREGLKPEVKWSETPGNVPKTDPTLAKGWRKMRRANETLSNLRRPLSGASFFVGRYTRSSAPGFNSGAPLRGLAEEKGKLAA